MADTIANIDEYIEQFDEKQRSILQQVREAIWEVAPKGSLEGISYKMPVVRYKGNIIFFAINKEHLGLYPGPEAITRFADRLTAYKTSKGAIRVPLDAPIPKQLIQEMVRFNIEKTKDKQGPNWYVSRGDWKDAEAIMEQIIGDTGLKKEFKWGGYIYTYKGKNVIGWGGFKNFFALWFYQGVFLRDDDHVLVSASEGKTKALRQWRFTDSNEMDANKILAYINESIQTIDEGKILKPEIAAPKEAAGLFKEALDHDAGLRNAFYGLTPGKRKEYIEYIEEAKQEKTKLSRLEKIKGPIMEGKGLHDKYRT